MCFEDPNDRPPVVKLEAREPKFSRRVAEAFYRSLLTSHGGIRSAVQALVFHLSPSGTSASSLQIIAPQAINRHMLIAFKFLHQLSSFSESRCPWRCLADYGLLNGSF